MNPGTTLTLKQVREHLRKSCNFGEVWLPESLIRMAEIPKGPTGKPMRIGLASKILGHPTLGRGVREFTSWDFNSGWLRPVVDPDIDWLEDGRAS
eukprot:gnl/MRDRNA2_/MRDRNA2_297227_c0_seq1.p2 gnl/MRDRNA2_/MRDRNA2_297227_c0~~gnl/MRDRNA2_/MRDRNA2_297227_c0_seq1.p2  ORF type:complete len:103 (+),score=18.83 gnl/MRDRNA2_/MRDRNA2_297227_c0_seq1:27-311(+)